MAISPFPYSVVFTDVNGIQTEQGLCFASRAAEIDMSEIFPDRNDVSVTWYSFGATELKKYLEIPGSSATYGPPKRKLTPNAFRPNPTLVKQIPHFERFIRVDPTYQPGFAFEKEQKAN